MANCRIVNQAIIDAVANIGGGTTENYQGYALKYQEAGTTFVTALTNAIADMQGAYKDALETYIDTIVKPFVEQSLPAGINGLSVVLEANRSSFESMDTDLAKSISAESEG